MDEKRGFSQDITGITVALVTRILRTLRQIHRAVVKNCYLTSGVISFRSNMYRGYLKFLKSKVLLPIVVLLILFGRVLFLYLDRPVFGTNFGINERKPFPGWIILSDRAASGRFYYVDEQRNVILLVEIANNSTGYFGGLEINKRGVTFKFDNGKPFTIPPTRNFIYLAHPSGDVESSEIDAGKVYDIHKALQSYGGDFVKVFNTYRKK